MKISIIIISIIVSSVNCYSNPIDSIFLRGYYLISFNKKDIIEKQKNFERQKLGQSYEISIDMDYSEYFIEYNNRLDHEINFSKLEKVIIIQSGISYFDLLKDYCKVDKTLNIEKNNFQSKIFYKLWRKSKFKQKCFKVFYIEGWFTGIPLDKCSLNILSKQIRSNEVPFEKRLLCFPLKLTLIENNPNVSSWLDVFVLGT